MTETIINYAKPIAEILILWFVFYALLLFLKGTRAIQVLRGVIILILAFFVAQILGLHTLNWILTKLFAISVIAFLIIFQPELRRGLASLGERPAFAFFQQGQTIIDELTKATFSLSRKKIGALIAIEREAALDPYLESGVQLDSKVNYELITTIFMPNTPLHDGGIVVQGNKIIAAGCLFPLTQSPMVSKTLGTRHRAAIGLTEETDSVVIVISEETGAVSIAIGGRLTRELDTDGLMKMLRGIYGPKKKQSFWTWLGAKGEDRRLRTAAAK